MAQVIPFIKDIPHFAKSETPTRDLKTTFFSLEDVRYDVVDMHGFQLEKHLRATERLFPEEAKGWFKQHSTCQGYALRYDDKTWTDTVEVMHLPLIRVGTEPYILVYELGPITMVQLTAYQAMSLGEIDPTMLDILFADCFQPLVLEIMGLEVLRCVFCRLTPFDTLSLAKPRQKTSQTRDGRQPKGYYMYGPNKGKPFYGPDEE